MPTCCIWFVLLIGSLLHRLRRQIKEDINDEGVAPSYLYME